MASITSARMSLGCGLVNRMRSMPSTESSDRRRVAKLVSTAGRRSRPYELTFWPRSVSSRTPSPASRPASRTMSSGWRLCSRPRTDGTMQYEQLQLHPVEICIHAWNARSRFSGSSPENVSKVEKWPRGTSPPAWM